MIIRIVTLIITIITVTIVIVIAAVVLSIVNNNKTTINNNAASNTIRGVYHIGRSTPGGAALTTLDYITIATTGNAQDFGDLSYVTRDGCGLSDSHGGLSY